MLFALPSRTLAESSLVVAEPDIFISHKEAKEKWGEQPLDLKMFQNLPIGKRAAFAASILKNQSEWHGKTRKQILDLFGQTSGYFWSERFPVYIVETGLGDLLVLSNIVIDTEVAWHLWHGNERLHTFFHTYLGATTAGIVTYGVYRLIERA